VREISLDLLRELSVIPEQCSKSVADLFAGAIENTDLSITDYLTIRDLVDLTGYDAPQVHALLILMFTTLRRGSVCLRLEEEAVRGKIASFAGKGPGALADKIISGINKYPELIHVVDMQEPGLFKNPGEAFKPLILTVNGDSRLLYFHKYFLSEQNFQENLARFLGFNRLLVEEAGSLAGSVDLVLNRMPVCFNGSSAEFNIGQKIGMVLPALKNLVVISGGPGTGKTSIALNCIRILTRAGIPAQRIRLAAPTGRAAQRLSDAIRTGLDSIEKRDAIDDDIYGIQGTTIHRLLDYNPSRNIYMHNRYRKIGADAVIIDEASMVDITLLGRLFQALDTGTRVVLLGDRDQLPSVEAGAMLAHLIPEDSTALYSKEVISLLEGLFPGEQVPRESGKGKKRTLPDRIVVLKDSYRSGEEIGAAAARIKRQDRTVFESIPVCAVDDLPRKGIWKLDPARLRTGGAGGFQTLVSRWVEENFLEPAHCDEQYRELIVQASHLEIFNRMDQDSAECMGKIFRVIEASRILSPIRNGPFGTGGINRSVFEQVAVLLDPGNEGIRCSGVPVMVTRNDYRLGLFNGDVGVILRGKDSHYYGIFRQGSEYLSYPVESLPPHELSFCITIHKSQGSEYNQVLLVVPDGVSENLRTKEVLYTAITRARDLVIVCCSKDAFNRSLFNRIERDSGIILV
jgi:exodeoxyribonuclease V alpha subunit